MSLTEVEFLYFFPLAFALYWLMPARRIAQNAALLAISWAFYAAWNWHLLWILVGGALLDYAVLRGLAGTPATDATNGQKRRLLLGLSLLFSLGALALFKYAGFFASSLQGLGIPAPVLHLTLPLGISFYTLQRVGYVVDVYWERTEAPDSLLDFLLFSSFFAQLAAGPISRGRELMPQIQAPRRLNAELLAHGAGAFLLGYVLKGWAADGLGQQWVDPVYGAPGSYGRMSCLLAVIGYPLQVFGDFAGYSAMAIGVGRLFGLELPLNFNFPFLSRSLPELWRRWHITLNRWLFDYIFTPMTTSNGWFRGRIAVALLVTFLASGLWHGATWTFVAWGLLHGLGMIAHEAWDLAYRKQCRKDRSFVALRKTVRYQLAAWAVTISFFVISLVPFRAPTFAAAVGVARGLLLGSALPPVASVSIGSGALAAACIIGYHLLELPGLQRIRARFFALPAPVRGVVYGLIVAWLILRVPTSAGSFIYQQF